MQRTFSYILLITWFILSLGCKTKFVANDINSKNILVSDSIAQLDSQVVEMYLPYKKILDKDMSKVISVSENEMIKKKPESELTNFLADLLLAEAEKIADSLQLNFKPQISYFNYGGIRTFLPKGEITMGKIYELMPFENQMVYLELTGSQVQEFLDIIAARGGGSIGGATFSISNEKAAHAKINGKPLDEQSKYWLVTNDYIAAGGDDMEVLTQRKELVSSGEKIRDIIIAHLNEMNKKDQIITGKTDGRIRYE